jgi:glucose/arabinose dehydrogenase
MALAAASGPASAQGQAQAMRIAEGLSAPIFAAAPPGDSRVFVAERAGRIRIVKNGVVLATPFLDIRNRVGQGGEGGLLGFAFPPDYAMSRIFAVYFTDASNDSVVARFRVTSNPDVADPVTEQLLLYIDQPAAYGNHRGGTIGYGPDGFLWFATGDGGGTNDPSNVSQDPQSLLGKMLRIDVGPFFARGSIPVSGQRYRIPADNPFVGAAPPRDEIWALGLRNPFRWSFDRETGDLWIADVGQAGREEVDFEPVTDPGGRNYGWDVMEGARCNTGDPAPAPPCNAPALTLPVHEYDHSAGDCSIIGGALYRADQSALRGLYFFGDFCTGRIWSLDPATRRVVDRTAQLGVAAGLEYSLVDIGEDGFGRPLIVQMANGTVYRISAAPLGCGLGPELVLALPALVLVGHWRRSRALSEV